VSSPKGEVGLEGVSGSMIVVSWVWDVGEGVISGVSVSEVVVFPLVWDGGEGSISGESVSEITAGLLVIFSSG
jgi:hypothetical protein